LAGKVVRSRLSTVATSNSKKLSMTWQSVHTWHCNVAKAQEGVRKSACVSKRVCSKGRLGEEQAGGASDDVRGGDRHHDAVSIAREG
jgi:hypothetical protein